MNLDKAEGQVWLIMVQRCYLTDIRCRHKSLMQISTFKDLFLPHLDRVMPFHHKLGRVCPCSQNRSKKTINLIELSKEILSKE